MKGLAPKIHPEVCCPTCHQPLIGLPSALEFRGYTFEDGTVYGPEGTAVLTKTQAKIVKILFLAKGRRVSREQLYDAVYPEDDLTGHNVNNISVQVMKARIRLHQRFQLRIETIWGNGYRLALQGDYK